MFGALLLFEEDFLHIVSITFTSLILTELLMVALTIRTWHYLMALAELLSFGIYVASLVIFHEYFGESLKHVQSALPATSWLLGLNTMVEECDHHVPAVHTAMP